MRDRGISTDQSTAEGNNRTTTAEERYCNEYGTIIGPALYKRDSVCALKELGRELDGSGRPIGLEIESAERGLREAISVSLDPHNLSIQSNRDGLAKLMDRSIRAASPRDVDAF
jgi:hypothetical protein